MTTWQSSQLTSSLPRADMTVLDGVHDDLAVSGVHLEHLLVDNNNTFDINTNINRHTTTTTTTDNDNNNNNSNDTNTISTTSNHIILLLTTINVASCRTKLLLHISLQLFNELFKY